MNNQIREMKSIVESNPDIPGPAKKEIISRFDSLPEPLRTDVWIYRMVVGFLGISVTITIIGGLLLVWKGGASPNYQMPQGIIAIGSASVGALAGLLAPSPRQ